MVSLLGLLLAGQWLWTGAAQGADQPVLLWDTVKHSDQCLAPEAVAKRDGWKEAVGEDMSIAGDACLANPYLALVLRKGTNGAEWYYSLGDKLVKGPDLVPVAGEGDKAKAMESVRAIDSTKESVLLEATYTTESGKKIVTRCLLKKDKPFIETQAREGTEKILVETQSQYAVLPDPFGGDIVVNAEDTQSPQVRLPSEHMLLQLGDSGNAIVMCVWRSGDQQVRLMLDGAGEKTVIAGTEIAYKKDKDMSVWVGVLAAPAIWDEEKIGELDPVKDKKLDWKIPFRAVWRADYRRQDGLIDSWRFAVKKGKDEFDFISKRTGWTPTRGTYAYPACIENDVAYLRNSRFESLPDLKYKGDGVVLIYPFQKAGESPAGVYGALDVLKEALEDTPEFTLADDLQVKHVPMDRYPGTCATTAVYEKVFEAKEEKAKKKDLLERLYKMNFFCIVIRSRIEEYVNWRKEFDEFCAREKAAKPQIAGLVDELHGMAAGFDGVWEKFKLGERTPAAAHILTDKVTALIDSNEDKKDEKAKQLGRDTRTIGGSQDAATGYYRRLTKELRQRAGYRMAEAKDDASFDFAREARRRTMDVLQTGFGAEGAFRD